MEGFGEGTAITAWWEKWRNWKEKRRGKRRKEENSDAKTGNAGKIGNQVLLLIVDWDIIDIMRGILFFFSWLFCYRF